MLRRTISFSVLALVLLAPVYAGAKAKSKTASVRVAECKPGDAAETRSATFLGRMRAVRGSHSMLMRFTLYERFGDERLHSVKSPELRAWREAKPGVREFRFRQTVTALQGGGQYRMRVDFRWLDAEGNLIRKARSMSPACNQPGDLPNLRIAGISAQPGSGGTATYLVSLQNNGQVTTRDFAVDLFVDGAATNVGHVDAVAPGETREVRFTGPVCERSLRAVADSGDSVKERFESDNVLRTPCPSPRG